MLVFCVAVRVISVHFFTVILASLLSGKRVF